MKIILILIFSSWLYGAFAQSPARSGRDYAVFFTAYDYDERQAWQPLPNIPGEVEFLANDLRSIYGFDVKIVSNATRDDIINTLKSYDNNRLYASDSQLLLFFSMHGQRTAQNQGYLIPRDGGASVTSGKWLSHTDLSDMVNALPCPRILVSIDACFSGTFGPNLSKPMGADWEIGNLDCVVKKELAFKNKYPARKYLTAGRAEDRIPTDGKYATRWRKALQSKGGEDGILSYAELWGMVDQVDVVRPTNGNFGSGRESGEFVFMCQTCCGIPIKETDLNMKFVKGGTFQMGCTSEQQDCDTSYYPIYTVTVPDFYIGQYEVTQNLWKKVMGEDNMNYADCGEYYLDCDQCPVVNVSWINALEFIGRLNVYFPNKKYRLPVGSEWEYAARSGGKKVRFGNGKNIANPKEMNFDCSKEAMTTYSVTGEYRNRIMPVGSFEPNALGLYDMSGNVDEWCLEWSISKDYLLKPPPPFSGEDSPFYIYRGGAYDSSPNFCQVFSHDGGFPDELYFPSLGFRLARTP